MRFHNTRFAFNHVQRRSISSIPRAVLTVFRLPLALGVATAGAISYINLQYQAIDSFGDPLSLGSANLPELKSKFIPDWMYTYYDIAKDYIKSVTESDESNQSNQPNSQDEIPLVPVDSNTNKNSNNNENENHELMLFTRKLIEIRNLLKDLPLSSDFLLPSIVVIGSQSSGKSSVLEAIVGQEFLPKGNNMVTRRPIELTLIHTPDSDKAYGEFPALGFGKIYDFKKIQNTLTELNEAVSQDECVSSKPIELKVYSKNVPDLTLIDLPGYIQINTKNQPPILRTKIQELCHFYINQPNIILAVSAADVDLANSEALRAARSVDPLGTRTIGVITKMDLVDPSTGSRLLLQNDYPLQLGYCGVIAKLQNNQNAFNQPAYQNPEIYVGTSVLRKRLVYILEQHMKRDMHEIAQKLQHQLDDARYQFKVHFNDRRISAEAYVTDTMDLLKQKLKQISIEFGPEQLKSSIDELFKKKTYEILLSVYKNHIDTMDKLSIEPVSQDLVESLLNTASSMLIKSGVGKITTEHIAAILLKKMDELIQDERFMYHEETREKVLKFGRQILLKKFVQTIDHVENTIKPIKSNIIISQVEWEYAIKKASEALLSRINESKKVYENQRNELGKRKFRKAQKELERIEKEYDVLIHDENEFKKRYNDFTFSMNETILEKTRVALEKEKEFKLFERRFQAIKSKQCSTIYKKKGCPEVYLQAISEKLSEISSTYLWSELVDDFYKSLPGELDSRLYYSVKPDDIKKFAFENPGVAEHLIVQGKVETLESVMDKMNGLLQLE